VGDQSHALATSPSDDTFTVPPDSSWKDGSKAGLDAVEKRKLSCLGLESNHSPSVVQPLANYTTFIYFYLSCVS
jgi:hypothetical protein